MKQEYDTAQLRAEQRLLEHRLHNDALSNQLSECKLTLLRKESEVSDLRAQLIECKGATTTKELESSHYKGALASKESELVLLRAQVVEYKGMVDRKEGEIALLKSELKGEKDEEVRWKEQIETLNRKIAKYFPITPFFTHLIVIFFRYKDLFEKTKLWHSSQYSTLHNVKRTTEFVEANAKVRFSSLLFMSYTFI